MIELFKLAPLISPPLYLSFFALSYLSGSIPFGLLLTQLFGYGDLRKIGSGNIGATNAFRTGNKWLAALTLLLDGLKGFAALAIIQAYEYYNGSENTSDDRGELYPNIMYLIGLSAILGHVFPVWLKFKGGKGVATAIGTLFFIAPEIALVLVSLWLIVFLLSRISSLSALGAFMCSTLVTAILYYKGIETTKSQHYIYLLMVTLLIFFTHMANIIRLINGTEPKMEKKK